MEIKSAHKLKGVPKSEATKQKMKEFHKRQKLEREINNLSKRQLALLKKWFKVKPNEHLIDKIDKDWFDPIYTKVSTEMYFDLP